jgi:integrase
MKTKFERTKCSVILKKSRHRKGGYYLAVEAYPVYSDNSDKPERPTQAMGLLITTPIWDKNRPTRGGGYLPKRNAEGVIQCKSKPDQEACEFAQKYAQKQQTEYDHKALYPEQYKQKNEADKKAKMDFIQYVEKYIERRRPLSSGSLTYQWESMLRFFKNFIGNKKLPFGNLTPLLANQFREYLMTAVNDKGKPLKPNSQKLYLAHFKSALYQAYKEDILSTDLRIKVESIKGEETFRDYLTTDELQKVANTPCDDDETRRAALFSALTGLRHIDISNLKWNNITRDETDEPFLEFRQRKTGGIVSKFISLEARILCGERKNPDDLIFPNIAKDSDLSDIIRAWVKSAGVINKDITFHCFRHTYATLQLEGGTELFVVSKLLGHTDVTTTQIYTHLTNKQNQTATNVIKLNINQ